MKKNKFIIVLLSIVFVASTIFIYFFIKNNCLNPKNNSLNGTFNLETEYEPKPWISFNTDDKSYFYYEITPNIDVYKHKGSFEKIDDTTFKLTNGDIKGMIIEIVDFNYIKISYNEIQLDGIRTSLHYTEPK